MLTNNELDLMRGMSQRRMRRAVLDARTFTAYSQEGRPTYAFHAPRWLICMGLYAHL